MPRPAARTARATIPQPRRRPGRDPLGQPHGARPRRERGHPGDFTGYGFDQCLGPTQSAMNRWLTHSPFLRGGHLHLRRLAGLPQPAEPHPEWVSTQLRKGWRLLPITLGPQASCQPRFPRYGDDQTIIPTPGKNGRYPRPAARAAPRPTRPSPRQRRWASSRAARCGTTSRASTPRTPTAASPRWRSSARGPGSCTRLDYVSGVYSSAGSGIAMLDNARVNRPGSSTCPTRSGSPGGTASRTRPRRTSARTAGATRPRQAVPGRSRRGLGRREDQHRQQLPRRRPRLRGRPPSPTATAWPSTSAATSPAARHSGQHPGPRAGEGAAVPAQGEGRVRAGRLSGRYSAGTLAAVQRLAERMASPVRPLVPAELDVAAQRRERAGAEGRLRRSEVRRLQRALNAASATRRSTASRQRRDDRPPAQRRRPRGDRRRRRLVLGGPARGPAQTRVPAARRATPGPPRCRPVGAPNAPTRRACCSQGPEVTGQRIRK